MVKFVVKCVVKLKNCQIGTKIGVVVKKNIYSVQAVGGGGGGSGREGYRWGPPIKKMGVQFFLQLSRGSEGPSRWLKGPLEVGARRAPYLLVLQY